MLRWSIKLIGILMVWKCPPLNLPVWNNLWKWKKEIKDENSTGHRDEQPAQQDLVSGNKEH